MADKRTVVAETARRHGLSEGAVGALWDALVRGGGRGAQFSHPELGGMGQWSGGMLQIGDMFNDVLKGKVAAALADLAPAAAEDGDGQADARRPDASEPRGRDWWPSGLGQPSSTGAQNASRYAVFPEARRLAVERDGRITLYDTGDLRISGAAQQGGGAPAAPSFATPEGPVALDTLRAVER